MENVNKHVVMSKLQLCLMNNVISLLIIIVLIVNLNVEISVRFVIHPINVFFVNILIKYLMVHVNQSVVMA